MNKTIIPKRLPTVHPPDPQARAYLRLVLLYQREYEKLVREGLKGLITSLRDIASKEQPRADSATPHMDVNIPKSLAVMFDLVTSRLRQKFPDPLLQRWVKSMIGGVNKKAKDDTQKVAAAVEIEAEPLFRDGDLSPYFQNVVDENVALIRSIPEEKIPAFTNALTRAITADERSSTIAEMIQKHFGATKSKAKLIARDQVGKLNGKLNQYRQEQLGGTRYVWRTSKDERVRPDHNRLDGKTFRWDDPPIVDRSAGRRGNPGEDFQCRCHAEMVLEDVVQ